MKPSIEIILPKNHYLSMVEPFKSLGIPVNSIINKLLAGAGITHFLIMYAKHHSIGILPNVPVIESKVKEHNAKYPGREILGVYKGIDVEDIEEYLLKDEVEFKKILTTPEGFIKKVMKAFEGNEEQLYNDFFLLFDECERIITDISYRGAIAAPLNEFFNFKNKALVSATTLPFSSELFKDFDHYVVKPDFEYWKPLTVVPTNNTIAALSKVIQKIDSPHMFIFLNSTNGINAVLKGLGIEKDSAVFCAQESVVKLLAEKFKNASSEFDKAKLKKYNFFTSRYFSAIDMKFDFNADVIMVSDIVYAEHSMLDPHTEVIQIAGRFRNGVNSLTHITSFDPKIEVMAQAEALSYFEGCLDLHEEIVRLLNKDKHKSSVDMLKFLNEKSPVANFYVNGKRNPFMLDNALNEVRVRGYYKELDNLKAAYAEVSNHFKVTYEPDMYPISDAEVLKFYSLKNQKETLREAARLIYKLTSRFDHYVFLSDVMLDVRNKLVKLFPFIDDAVRLIGLDRLEATGYVRSVIDKALKEARLKEELARIAPIIYQMFQSNTTVAETELIAKLYDIASEQGYKYTVSASLTKKFFDARRTTEQGVNVWKIGNRLNEPIQESSNS